MVEVGSFPRVLDLQSNSIQPFKEKNTLSPADINSLDIHFVGKKRQCAESGAKKNLSHFT